MYKRIPLFLISTGLFFYACNRPSEGSRKAGEHIKNTVHAIIETDPVPQRKNEDAADDPAIWIHPENPEKSIIIGTDKKGGLATYNLEGEELYYFFTGDMNNCDVRYDFLLTDKKVDVVAASNRTFHSLSLYKIQENGILDSLHSRIIKSEMKDEVYGLCMYKSPKSGKYYVFMNSKAGEVEQYELIGGECRVDAKLVRSFSVGTQTEGMVADDENQILYLGHEVAGIWKFDAEPDGSNKGTFIELSSEENPNIKYDVEGLAIYDSGNGEGYLIASSQGNYSYALFERQGNNKYLGSFRITDGEIDGVEETDGLDVTNVALGKNYPSGMLVVQDGFNYDGNKKIAQNFKSVSWKEVERIISNL
jgi:3-phytase